MFPQAAVEAALRSAAATLGGARVGLYLAGADDRLALAHTAGETPDLSSVAELLGGEAVALDLRGVAAGAADGVGIGWGGAPRGALLALLPAAPTPEAGARLADAAAIVSALTGAPPDATPDAVHLLADLAVCAGSVDDRLALALVRLAGLLGMDAATLALLDGDAWQPLVAHDPSGLTPTTAVPLASTPGALIAMADGPVGVADGGDAFGAFLGAPVFVGGRCAGVLCAVSAAPRAPFADAERDLVAALARWAAAALSGRQSAATLAEREATLATFFDTVPLALGTLDLDAAAPGGVRIVTANVHAARAFGAADLLPLGAAALAPWAGACRQALATGAAATFSFATGADEHVARHEATVVVLDASVPRFSFVTEDVTERDAAAHATAALQHAEAAASAARQALVGQVTHDLRSPLTAILGYADLLHAASTPDDVAEARDVIARAAERMVDALDHLSALTLVDAGRAAADRAPVHVAAVVEAVVEAHRVPAAAHRTALHVEVALPDVPVLLAPEQFQRLLRTLLAAAVSATVDGRIDGRIVADGDALVLDLMAAPAGAGDGLGPLGVEFVRGLVDVMGGRIDAGPDGGPFGEAWRWTLRLPYRPAPDAPVSDAPVSDAPVSDAPVSDAPVSDAPVGERGAVDALALAR